MALFTSLVGAEGTRIPGAAILSPRDGDPVDPEGLPMGDVRLTLDVPTGIHELDVRQMGAAFSGQAITVLVDRISLPDDTNCLACGGLRRP
ncbi:hypothetical protein [Phaeobacter inhibens]|uniref:hypothetical protein n=1 Tax=Phaeobacter inhibens TaxID=221822 RepID=UPI000C9CE20C|nr:hypothetical protein [Phaeobacter inhibens]